MEQNRHVILTAGLGVVLYFWRTGCGKWHFITNEHKSSYQEKVLFKMLITTVSATNKLYNIGELFVQFQRKKNIAHLALEFSYFPTWWYLHYWHWHIEQHWKWWPHKRCFNPRTAGAANKDTDGVQTVLLILCSAPQYFYLLKKQRYLQKYKLIQWHFIS